jgi:hypothetical protein
VSAAFSYVLSRRATRPEWEHLPDAKNIGGFRETSAAPILAARSPWHLTARDLAQVKGYRSGRGRES